MLVQEFFDPVTFTLTYVVYDDATRDAVVIDPVLDYDPEAAELSTKSLDAVSDFVRRNDLRVHYVLDTHAHADHVSGADELRQRFGAKVVTGARITEIQETFRGIFDLDAGFATDGRQFDVLVNDNDVVQAGALAIRVISTPGHTPACVSFLVEDALFTGDALFTEDYGTGRCDFPKGSARDLYQSVHDKLYALPDATRVFVGHDYLPSGRALRTQTTIGLSKSHNVQLKQSTTLEEFIAFRTARDATLRPPRLLFPSVQLNINAGRLPEAHANGRRYLTIPLNMFRKS